MTGLDIAILILLGLSTLISVVRGIVREVLSLMSWVLAFGIALIYAEDVSALFDGFVSVVWLRYMLGFLSIFVVTLLAASLISRFAAMLIKTTGLKKTDRMLGMVFGFARGIVIVAVLVILGTATPVQEENWWQNSRLLPYINSATHWAMDFVPRADISHVVKDINGL